MCGLNLFGEVTKKYILKYDFLKKKCFMFTSKIYFRFAVNLSKLLIPFLQNGLLWTTELNYGGLKRDELHP